VIKKDEALSFLITFSLLQLGSDEFWAQSLLPMVQIALQKDIKENKGVINLSKTEMMSMIHCMSQRKVVDAQIWSI